MTLPIAADLLPQYLRQSDQVIYSDEHCHGSLYFLNFCQFCKQLRDHKSMYYEIEMKRCTNCAETFTSAENSEKEMGCPQCFECPSCSQSLIVRSTVVSTANSEAPKEGEEKHLPDKRYYLVCQSCRWTTRGAGIPDTNRLPSVSSPWKFRPENARDPTETIISLADYYHGLSIHERGPVIQKAKDKHSSRRRPGSYNPLLTDKYKLVSVAQKRLSGMNEPPPDLVILKAKAPKVQFHEKLLEMKEDQFLECGSQKVVDGRSLLQSRLRYPMEQPSSISNVYPKKRPLSAKKTWRCKSCQHVLVKTDFAAHSVKFKMISAAPTLVPEIKPCNPQMKVGKECDFVLTINNPLNHLVKMTLSLPPIEEPAPKWIKGVVVQGLVIPESPLILLSRSVASGIDDKGKELPKDSPADDPKVIEFRKLYTVGVRLRCVPVSAENDNWVSFYIFYDYHESQTVFNPERSSDSSSESGGQVSWIRLRVDVNLGKASA